MQYVRAVSGSVSKTWNSINPATLSGAIDVIVVEREDGTLACSPFHVRFGKFSLLRPFEKKVEFKVNDAKQDYAMKLGEGGEAFFVFETSADVPEALQTSPLISPASSPQAQPDSPSIASTIMDEPEPLDLGAPERRPSTTFYDLPDRPPVTPLPILRAGHSMTESDMTQLSQSYPEPTLHSPLLDPPLPTREISLSSQSEDEIGKALRATRGQTEPPFETSNAAILRSNSPPPLSREDAKARALNLSRKLLNSKIPSQVTDEGDLMLDITGYKSSEEDTLRAEVIARQILSEELEGNYDIGSLIGADEHGHLWIYSSEEAKEAAARKSTLSALNPAAITSADALSDPGYQSDDTQSQKSLDLQSSSHERRESDSAISITTPPDSPRTGATQEPSKTYAKTLRLTSDQLKALGLNYGANPISFTVNRATCTASMYLWKQNVPIVVSDVDGTITKSDALGHVLNMIGRDWTHLGVAKLYSDIVANGYNIMYLTSRSVGQADTTRTYLNGIVQEGYKLPKGPVILSPDRTLAALRREVYLRKPEVFKMACLRDIMSLFPQRQYPFYAGFGNRLTDALSYRSVNIPSTRIFTINSNGEVILDMLSLNKYKTAYTSMRETVDHFFPPVGMLVHEGGEDFTDFNYWRERPLEMDELSMTASEESATRGRRGSYDDEEEDEDDEEEEDEDEGNDEDDEVFSDELNESYISRESTDDRLARAVRKSIEQDEGSEVAGLDEDDELNELEAQDDEMDLIAQAAGRNIYRTISRTSSEDQTASSVARTRRRSSFR